MESKTGHFNEHRCEHCKRIFTAKRNDAKYCCNSCRQKAYNLRGAIWVVKDQIEHHDMNYRNHYSRLTRFRPFEIENILSDLRLFRNRPEFKTLPKDHELRRYYDEVLVKRYEELNNKVV